MRVTNQQQIDLLLGSIQRTQSNLARVQEMLASGKKVNRPSDDGRAFEEIVNLQTLLQKIDRRLLSINEGVNRLNTTEGAVSSVDSIIQRAKEIALQEVNATSSAAERKAAAVEVQQLLLSLVDAADSKVNARYLFSGYETQTAPYTLATVTSSADPPAISADPNNQGTTSSTVSIQTAGSLTGDEYKITFTSATTFDVKNQTTGATVLSSQTYASGGNIDFAGLRVVLTNNPSGPLSGDEFTITAHNSSDATVSASVSTQSALQPDLYELRFTSTTQFDIVDLTTDQVLSTGNSYTTGANIVFAGITVVVTDGTVSPQAGDVFRARPAYSYQGDTGTIAIEVEDGKTVPINSVGSRVFSGPDVDLFKVFQDLHQALVTNAPADLTAVISSLDTGLDQIVDAQADIGARVNRLDRFEDALELLSLSTQDRRSTLEDADIAKVASDLLALETNLTASLLVLNRQFQISLLEFLR